MKHITRILERLGLRKKPPVWPFEHIARHPRVTDYPRSAEDIHT